MAAGNDTRGSAAVDRYLGDRKSQLRHGKCVTMQDAVQYAYCYQVMECTDILMASSMKESG